MLGTTLWLTIAIGLLATAMLDGAAAFAHARVHAAAEHAVESAMHDALAAYQNRLGAAIANASASDAADGYAAAIASVPNPLLGANYEVVPTTLAPPACGAPDSTASAPDAIGWLQCGGGVAESRMSLHVTARVLDPGGAVLAQRERYVTLRLFALPPYSAVVGSKDGDAATLAGGDPSSPPHEGDIGGDTISGSASPGATPWPAGGTLVHVRYECHDGAGSCANAAPPDPDASLQPGVRWQNGNRPAP